MPECIYFKPKPSPLTSLGQWGVCKYPVPAWLIDYHRMPDVYTERHCGDCSCRKETSDGKENTRT